MSARAEQIASVEQRIDNLIGAMQLPMPPAFHLEQLKSALPEIRDTLRLIYIAETGEDPWDSPPGESAGAQPSDKKYLPAASLPVSAPAGVRMLTPAEVDDAIAALSIYDGIEAVQRRFAEVNGLKLTAATTKEPK